MNRHWERAHYSTALVHNDAEGCTALELRRGGAGVVARVVIWHAAGQFYLDSVHGEVPLDTVAALIVEARARIPVK